MFLDPLALRNNGSWEPDATTLILGLFLLMIFGVYFQMSRNVRKNRIDVPDCGPHNRDRDSNNDRFQPPPID